MSTDLTIHVEGGIDKADNFKELGRLVEVAEQNVADALSPNTKRAYRSQWNKFVQWCESMGLPSFPVDEKVLLVYLTHRAEKGAALSTLTQMYAAIREKHREQDVDPPTLKGKLYRSWTGARKKASQEHDVDKALALTPEHLKAAVGACKGVLGPRDKAMLLVGWCAALRSDEIIALRIEDISIEEDGLRIKIRKSKTDQMGAGHEIGVARMRDENVCPVAAWTEYLEGELGLSEGLAFVSRTNRPLHGKDVTRRLQARLKGAGVQVKGYSSHSLRAGCITAASQAGFSMAEIQRQSRHKSLEVLAGYIRTATLLTDNVTKDLL